MKYLKLIYKNWLVKNNLLLNLKKKMCCRLVYCLENTRPTEIKLKIHNNNLSNKS